MACAIAEVRQTVITLHEARPALMLDSSHSVMELELSRAQRILHGQEIESDHYADRQPYLPIASAARDIVASSQVHSDGLHNPPLNDHSHDGTRNKEISADLLLEPSGSLLETTNWLYTMTLGAAMHPRSRHKSSGQSDETKTKTPIQNLRHGDASEEEWGPLHRPSEQIASQNDALVVSVVPPPDFIHEISLPSLIHGFMGIRIHWHITEDVLQWCADVEENNKAEWYDGDDGDVFDSDSDEPPQRRRLRTSAYSEVPMAETLVHISPHTPALVGHIPRRSSSNSAIRGRLGVHDPLNTAYPEPVR